MKTQTKPKSKFRGFYTALALSLVMIGAACVFAYRQTSQTLEQNLNSLSEQMEVTTTATLPYEAPVVGVQTDVAMETETTVTATSATEETAAPETTPETTAPETEPEETPMHQLTPPLSDFSILNPFSDGELVKSETTGTWQTHNGVDLSCAAGSDVFAIDTGTVSEVLIKKAIEKVFDLSVAGTIEKLDLKKPVYAQTAVGGHFGKDFLAWELVDKAEELSDAVNKG